MRRIAAWTAALLVGLGALAGSIAILASRDTGGVAGHADGPGRPYRGEPVLSPALEAAVARGNVVVLYRDARPPTGTAALVPPGGKALEDAGQSVLVDREPTLTTALAAVSATRIQPADAPAQLQPFIDYWLGRR
jgi:hypothetical protein